MNCRRAVKFILIAVAIVVALTLADSHAFAQCAMCKTSLAGSPDAARLAERFNLAVLVLLIPPVLLFCGFIIAVYRFRKAPGQESLEASHAKSLLRFWLNKLSARIGRRKRRGRETGRAIV